MKNFRNSSKRTKLVMRAETIVRLTSREFGLVVGGVDRHGQALVTIASDEIMCGGGMSETHC
jgi:hypothetical protein